MEEQPWDERFHEALKSVLLQFREDDDFFRRVVLCAVPKKQVGKLEFLPLQLAAAARLLVGLHQLHRHLIHIHPVLMRMI